MCSGRLWQQSGGACAGGGAQLIDHSPRGSQTSPARGLLPFMEQLTFTAVGKIDTLSSDDHHWLKQLGAFSLSPDSNGDFTTRLRGVHDMPKVEVWG